MIGVHLTNVIELFYFQRMTLWIPYYTFLPTAIPSSILRELSGRWFGSLGTALRHERTVDVDFAMARISRWRSVEESVLTSKQSKRLVSHRATHDIHAISGGLGIPYIHVKVRIWAECPMHDKNNSRDRIPIGNSPHGAWNATIINASPTYRNESPHLCLNSREAFYLCTAIGLRTVTL
jgi:hypothetical protein